MGKEGYIMNHLSHAQEQGSGIYQHSKDNDCTLIESAIFLNSQMIKNQEIWPEPIVQDDDSVRVNVDLFIKKRERILHIKI